MQLFFTSTPSERNFLASQSLSLLIMFCKDNFFPFASGISPYRNAGLFKICRERKLFNYLILTSRNLQMLYIRIRLTLQQQRLIACAPLTYHCISFMTVMRLITLFTLRCAFVNSLVKSFKFQKVPSLQAIGQWSITQKLFILPVTDRIWNK